MFSKNLEFYRLKNNMTKKKLASLCSLSSIDISNYESGKRYPENMDIIQSLANALGVKVSDFLVTWNKSLIFKHGEFRKTVKLNLQTQKYISKAVEEYFNRFFTVIEILGDQVLPAPLKCHCLTLNDDIEQSALVMRKHLSLPEHGPIGNLIERLENKGIFMYACDIDNDSFFGRNGFVNSYPYIIFNKHMPPERTRSDIAHELAHLLFKWPNDLSPKNCEKIATAIGGAFLCPANDMKRELGLARKTITKDMLLVCKEYGVFMSMLVKRAEVCNIINKKTAGDFFIYTRQRGIYKHETSIIPAEEPSLFKQLVYRAITENGISLQKGAELLKTSYDDIKKHCYFDEVEF